MEDQMLTCNGKLLKSLAKAGRDWLRSHYHHVNELNVFPVPDGDTGTNMLMTMENAYKEVEHSDSTNAARIASSIGRGAMMGSRGNSGTIMSQLWIGFGKALGEAEAFDAELLAKALREATETAYRGVQRPVEGTILTVAREMTEEIEASFEEEKNLKVLLEKMVTRGWQAVERTPELLPVLKKAGVVDSGGAGLAYVIEGMLRHLNGEATLLEDTTGLSGELLQAQFEEEGPQIEHPGENIYDVQFVVKGKELHAPTIKSAMERMGDSVVVVGAEDVVKVHVHVRNPGVPLEYAANVGPISDVVVENMLEQYEEYLRQRLGETAPGEEPLELTTVEPGDIAVVAVAAGPGMAKVFAGLGAAGLVNGGQTNNPSTQELLDAIEALATDKVILLPNNKNIILSANQVVQLAGDRQVRVIQTRTFPQGVAAMFNGYDRNGDLDEVYEAMNKASEEIITAEITTATRSVELDGVTVTQGQLIGLLDGQLKVSGDTIEEVALGLLSHVEDMEDMELITIYYGEDKTAVDAQALVDTLADTHENMEFDVVFGGQPHYPYILSIE
ncbi:MAG: DAK2 domain-containing protein [Chloroflexi bacterium]|nr:DAK2 domain-containing protein [Chloroflexota bacterium]